MDTERFLETYFTNASAAEIRFTRNWIIFAEEAIGAELSKESLLANRDKVPYLFFGRNNLGKNNSLSRSKYFSIKKILGCVLDYFSLQEELAIPSFENLSEMISAKKFFKNLQEVLVAIEKASIISMGKNYNQETAATNLKCICILGWHGFSYADMSSCLGSDLHRDTDHFYVNKGEEQIEIKGSEYEQLTSFDEACKTQGYPSGRTIYYKKTEYLFKTMPTGATPDGKVPVDTFKTIVKNFNSNNPLGVSLSINDLRKNGIFEKVYKRNNQLSAREELSKYVTDITKLSFWVKEYNTWVKFVAEV